MPAQLDTAPPAAGVRVQTSTLLDFAFCLFAAEKHAQGYARWTQPWIAGFTTDAPGLEGRIAAFWGDPGYNEWIELMLIGDAAGLLFETSPDIDWARLDRTTRGIVPIGPLATESEPVSGIVAQRLERLRSDADFRHSYFELLREFWAYLRPTYEAEAAAEARRMAANLQAQLDEGRDPKLLLPPNHLAHREEFTTLLEKSENDGRLVIVPLGLSGVGSGILDLPSGLICSLGPETEAMPGRMRAIAERLSANFKVLSDPTRMSLLLRMLHGPSSITELANVFGLSQPTVSVHVKLLREAGLLDSTRAKGSTMYSTSRDRLEALLNDAREEFAANRC